MTTTNHTTIAIIATAYHAAKAANENWAEAVDAALAAAGIATTTEPDAYDGYEDDGETIVILADGTRITTHDIV